MIPRSIGSYDAEYFEIDLEHLQTGCRKRCECLISISRRIYGGSTYALLYGGPALCGGIGLPVGNSYLTLESPLPRILSTGTVELPDKYVVSSMRLANRLLGTLLLLRSLLFQLPRLEYG